MSETKKATTKKATTKKATPKKTTPKKRTTTKKKETLENLIYNNKSLLRYRYLLYNIFIMKKVF